MSIHPNVNAGQQTILQQAHQYVSKVHYIVLEAMNTEGRTENVDCNYSSVKSNFYRNHMFKHEL